MKQRISVSAVPTGQIEPPRPESRLSGSGMDEGARQTFSEHKIYQNPLFNT